MECAICSRMAVEGRNCSEITGRETSNNGNWLPVIDSNALRATRRYSSGLRATRQRDIDGRDNEIETSGNLLQFAVASRVVDVVCAEFDGFGFLRVGKW